MAYASYGRVWRKVPESRKSRVKSRSSGYISRARRSGGGWGVQKKQCKEWITRLHCVGQGGRGVDGEGWKHT